MLFKMESLETWFEPSYILRYYSISQQNHSKTVIFQKVRTTILQNWEVPPQSHKVSPKVTALILSLVKDYSHLEVFTNIFKWDFAIFSICVPPLLCCG